MKTKLILVGGFLGAGKTTLLEATARRLAEQGKAVGLITNDQAPDLVDTALLSRSGAGVQEVAGSCFCCNFNGFIQAVHALIEQKADVIIAEPVGSCTDLSATIMQPVKDLHPEIDLAPLTVLADPGRALEVLQQKDSLVHPSALYILRLQMEEADRILLNKIDTLSISERESMVSLLREAFPQAEVGELSARSGKGLNEWLGSVLGANKAGQCIVEVDYDRYAEGEAVLGWLNALVSLESSGGGLDWLAYSRDLLENLHESFKRHSAEIGHVKLVIESDGKECVANLTHLEGKVAVQGDKAMTSGHSDLTLNVRVQMSPEHLETIVRQAFGASEGSALSATVRTLRCLMPGKPDPTHRYSFPV